MECSEVLHRECVAAALPESRRAQACDSNKDLERSRIAIQRPPRGAPPRTSHTGSPPPRRQSKIPDDAGPPRWAWRRETCPSGKADWPRLRLEVRDNGLRYAVPASADDDDRRRLEQRPLWKHLIFGRERAPWSPAPLPRPITSSRARSRARGLPRRETPPLWEDCCEPGHAPLANSGSGTTRRNSAPLSGGLYHTRLLLFRKGVVCALSLHSTHRPGAFSSSGRPPTCLSGSPLQRREGVRKHHQRSTLTGPASTAFGSSSCAGFGFPTPASRRRAHF